MEKENKTDSLNEKVVSKDTVNQIALVKKEEAQKIVKKANSKKSKYLFSLRTGTGFTRNSFEYQDSNSVKEKNLFQIQVDGIYNIFSLGPKTNAGISTGLNFNSHKEDFSRTKRITTNTFVGYDSTLIFYDSLVFQVDSSGAIIDSSTITLSKYEVNSIYENITSLKNENLSYSVFSFSLPFQFSLSQQFGQNFYADIMAGGVVSYQSVKFSKEANPLIPELD